MWDESALKNKPSKYYGILECWSSKVPWVTANDPRDFYTIKIPVRFQTFCCLTFVRAFSRVLKMTVHVACVSFFYNHSSSSWMTVRISNFFLSVLFLNPNVTFTPVLRMRIRMDLDHFGKLDPDLHQREKAGSGSAPKWKGGSLSGSFWRIRWCKSGKKWVVGSGCASKWCGSATLI
jgi:hypothetical protein